MPGTPTGVAFGQAALTLSAQGQWSGAGCGPKWRLGGMSARPATLPKAVRHVQMSVGISGCSKAQT
jgi:hypothetical protein